MQNRTDQSTLFIVISIILLILGSAACLIFADCLSSNVASIAGGMLSVAATTLLGVIALRQNKKYKELADEKSKQAEELMFTPECRLFDVYTNSQFINYRQIASVEARNSQDCYLLFSTLNLSMIDITTEEIAFYEKTNMEHNVIFPHNKLNFTVPRFTILKDGVKFEIKINIPEEFLNVEAICSVKLSYKNIYDSVVHKTVEFERAANGNTKITKQERAILIGK